MYYMQKLKNYLLIKCPSPNTGIITIYAGFPWSGVDVILSKSCFFLFIQIIEKFFFLRIFCDIFCAKSILFFNIVFFQSNTIPINSDISIHRTFLCVSRIFSYS